MSRNRSDRSLRRVAWVAAVALSSASTSWAADTACAARWVERVVKGITPENRSLAQDWVRRFQGADDVQARGMLKSVEVKDLKALLATFKNLPPNANPLGSPEEVYRVIGDLTEATLDGPRGLTGKLGELFSESNSQIGALLDLKVADELAKSGRKVSAFEHSVSVLDTNLTRRYDVVEPNDFAPPQLGGVVHENKNWTQPLSGPDDGLLVGLADQFERDILVHADTNFQFYKINLRDIVLGQSDMIRDKLLAQFDSPLVKEKLGPQAIENLRAQFTALWNAGSGGGLVTFY